MFMSMIEI